jgi:hypothetical protein
MNKLMAKTVAIIKVQVPASELSCKAHVRK